MELPHESVMMGIKVEAELRVPAATIHVLRFCWDEPVREFQTFLGENAHRINLALRPRPANARACYVDRWGPHRFEPMGEILFVPAGELIRVDGDPDYVPTINCLLHSEPIRTMLDDDFAWPDQHLGAGLNIRSSTIRTLITRLGEEARHPGFASQVLAESLAAQLVIELARYHQGIHGGPTTGGLAPWRMRIIDERLSEVCGPPTLTELGQLCGLSVRQLSRAFRASHGCPIGHYVAKSQVEHAKRLLITGESVKSIAFSLGFSSPENFSTAFRRATSQTPREYRQSQSAGRWTGPALSSRRGYAAK